MADPAETRFTENIARLGWEKKAENIKILDLRKFNAPADYFVIMSGTGEPHLKAICDYIEEQNKKNGTPVFRIDGYGQSEWIVMDYFTVLVHILHDRVRGFYDIEDLYADARSKAYTGPRKAATAKRKARK